MVVFFFLARCSVCPVVHFVFLLCLCVCRLQSAQNLAQISDLQAQLEEALKEKQEVQEKVSAGFLFLAQSVHTGASATNEATVFFKYRDRSTGRRIQGSQHNRGETLRCNERGKVLIMMKNKNDNKSVTAVNK